MPACVKPLFWRVLCYGMFDWQLKSMVTVTCLLTMSGYVKLQVAMDFIEVFSSIFSELQLLLSRRAGLQDPRFRREVLALLKKKGLINDFFIENMMNWLIIHLPPGSLT